MNYSDSSALADTGAPRHRHGQRLVLYLSLTLLVPLFVGLTVLLGAPAPAKTPPQSPGVEARIPSPDIPQALREPEPLLALKAEDVPLLKSLRERQMQLDEHDKQLADREAALRLVQQQIEDKLTSLAMLRKEMSDLLQEKAAFEEKRFEHLVKVYEVMKPEEVSSLFERLNEDTAARLLYQMKEKKAGQILASISPQVAAKLSERLATQRQQETQHTPVKEKR
jgi:flagellar motility protein MotE (MotC chaperone)